jgi:ferric-dicitrate binding protein FerR (iron transport regulator)
MKFSIVKFKIPKFDCRIFFLILVFLGRPSFVSAADAPASAEPGNAGASLVLLEGMASLVGKDNKKIRQLSVGDIINPGERLRTAIRGRAALKLPDESHLRLDELTTCELTTLSVDKTLGKRNIVMHLFTGNAWIHVPKAFKEKKGVIVVTPTATAEADTSTYRVSVHKNKSVLLKVYRGLIYLYRTTASMDSQQKEGPQPAGSQSNMAESFQSKKRWNHFVKTMYQILVRSDGTSTKPFRFMTKADKNEWVLWNQQLDKDIGN